MGGAAPVCTPSLHIDLMVTIKAARCPELDELAAHGLSAGSCCGLAVLKVGTSRMELRVGLAGRRQMEVTVSEAEKAMALEVVDLVLQGREDDFLSLLSPRALAAIPAAEWRSCARFGRGSKAEEPQVIGKMGVWVIVTARTKVKLWMSQKIKLLVFKVSVDPGTRQMEGFTILDQIPEVQAVPSEVQLADAWHFGSCTKAVTATLAAVLLEQEPRLSWDLTVADALAMAATASPSGHALAAVAAQSAFRDVTLEQLLTNRGGLWQEQDPQTWSYAWDLDREAHSTQEQRRRYYTRVLALQAHEVGKYEYSNDGFGLAGLMLETVLQESWEELVRKHIFEPLGMTNSGFYAMGASAPRGAQRNFIWGTRPGGPGEPGTPMDPTEGPGADNPAAIGPAGVIHGSLEDVARFLAVHLDHRYAQEKLGLSQATLAKLHGAPDDYPYAYGWLIGGSGILTHDGSNTMNYMHLKMWKEDGIAVISTLNAGLAASEMAQELGEKAKATQQEPFATDDAIDRPENWCC